MPAPSSAPWCQLIELQNILEAGLGSLGLTCPRDGREEKPITPVWHGTGWERDLLTDLIQNPFKWTDFNKFQWVLGQDQKNEITWTKPTKARKVFTGCTALWLWAYRQGIGFFKPHEPLDHATRNVPPDNRGEACARNEDLDTGAAENRSLLSTGQGLSYTHCRPAGTTITKHIINQQLLLQDSVL